MKPRTLNIICWIATFVAVYAAIYYFTPRPVHAGQRTFTVINYDI